MSVSLREGVGGEPEPGSRSVREISNFSERTAGDSPGDGGTSPRGDRGRSSDLGVVSVSRTRRWSGAGGAAGRLVVVPPVGGPVVAAVDERSLLVDVGDVADPVLLRTEPRGGAGRGRVGVGSGGGGAGGGRRRGRDAATATAAAAAAAGWRR